MGHKVGVDLSFSDEERHILKRIVRETIDASLSGKERERIEVPAKLKEKMGAFVCLKTRGELKGCIGYIRGVMPLNKTVEEMATQAAFHDPRFSPLSKSEWKHTEIEISVLTPMKTIEDIDEIEIGVHGLFIERDFASGLLLPQVAVENGWDKIAFLEHTCTKAGLSKDAWKSKDTKISIFSADVF